MGSLLATVLIRFVSECPDFRGAAAQVRLRDGLHVGGRPMAGPKCDHAKLRHDRVAHQAAGLQHHPPSLLLPGEPSRHLFPLHSMWTGE